MDFSRLPDIAFLKILKYLPLEECIRVGRVNNTFRRIAQLATLIRNSWTWQHRFRDITEDQLAVILDLCAPNLELIKFPCSKDKIGNYTEDWLEWRPWISPFDNRWRQPAMRFATYHCPRLVDIDLGRVPIDYPVFDQLIRNNPNVESLVWRAEFVGFPNIMNHNLKKLHLRCHNGATVQSIAGQCPNLKELTLFVMTNVTPSILSQVFASIPQVNRIDIHMADLDIDNHYIKLENVVSLWNLPLKSLTIQYPEDNYPEEDHILYKVASSFPNLQSFSIGFIKSVTNEGIAALAVLKELEFIQLHFIDFGHGQLDQGIRQLAHCRKLRKLDIRTSSISGDTLTALLRSCAQLDHIEIYHFREVTNPSEAVVVLEGLSGMAKRDITIKFHINERVWLKSIWEAEIVKERIKTLEENDGLKLKIVWKKRRILVGAIC